MIPVYALESAPESFTSSIFLAGPSPRKPTDPNWRAEAIRTLEALGYRGVVFAPVWRNIEDATENFNYDNQVEWERQCLNMADQIVFWVPRDMEKLPGFTTNVEYGMWVRSGKILLGSPDNAEKMTYLNWWADQEGVERHTSMHDLLASAVTKLGSGAPRSGGEREVPLHLWQKAEFRHWLTCQNIVGNRLEGAHVVWTFRVGKRKEKIFLWALHVRVWIASEQRSKINEVVVFRPDTSAVIAYCTAGCDPVDPFNYIMDTQVALVREFRSPAANLTAMVHELPGGSSLKPNTRPIDTAADELREETGLAIHAERFRSLPPRQVAATLSAHRTHPFIVKLSLAEMDTLRASAGTPHGNHADSEYTWVEVMTVREMLCVADIDWANIGMIFQAMMGA